MMTQLQSELAIIDWYAMGQVILAAILGGLVGLEREQRGRAAGLRTNIMIAVSSCLFTILSIEGFPLQGAAQDTARVAAQVVSGVGFLGAGVMFQTKREVHGLTTAATIWLVAAVGMCVGAGLLFIATFTTLLAIALLIGLSPLSHRLAERAHEEEKEKKNNNKKG